MMTKFDLFPGKVGQEEKLFTAWIHACCSSSYKFKAKLDHVSN